MALSQDIKSQFAKAMTPKKEPTEKTVNGTFKIINGKEYVQLDGSDILTPVKSTVVADTGDRVSVLIKDHNALVNGNITFPAARGKDLDNMKDEVDEFGNNIKALDNDIKLQQNSINAINTNIQTMDATIQIHESTIQSQDSRILALDSSVATINSQISSINSDISIQGSRIDSMDDTIESHGNSIKEFNDTIVSVNNKVESYDNKIEQMGNKITEFNSEITTINSTVTNINSTVTANNSSINVLNSAFDIVNGELTGLSKIIIDSLTTAVLNTGYAKIDFANIEMAAIEKVFSKSGIIKDLFADDTHITGELVGVTIKGDLIQANTLYADRLVVKGENGLYYKLNMDSLGKATVETDEKYQNGLDGSVIIAKSVTADRIQVTDLVAFGATIGGFTIEDHSIHSNLKTSATSPAMGLFLGDDGQLGFGDNEQYINHYKDDDGKWHLEIRTNDFKLNFNNTPTNISDVLNTIEQNAIDANKVIVSDTPPKIEGNEGKIWFNPSDKSFYDVKEGQWVITNNFANEIDDLNKRVNDVPGKINESIKNFEKDTLETNYALKQYVDSEISSTANGLRSTFNTRLIPIETDTADSKAQIREWRGFIDTGMENVISSPTAPTIDTNKVWHDSINDKYYRVVNGIWTIDDSFVPNTYMILGTSGSPYKVKIINNQLAILHNDQITSHWENNLFVVDRIESNDVIVKNQLTVGNFGFVNNNDGSVSFKKIG